MQTNVSGIFPVYDGTIVESRTSHGRLVKHISYKSLMFTELDDQTCKAIGTIQTYCPPCMQILPSETLVLITHGRILFTSNERGAFFSIETDEDLAPFTGDVNEKDYDFFLPEQKFLVPSLYVLGQVCSRVADLPDNGRSVDLQCISYTSSENRRQDYKIRCRLPPGPRWFNVSLPSPGSAFHVIGRLHTVLEVEDGTFLPVITIKQVVYNPDIRNSITGTQPKVEDLSPSSSQENPSIPRRVFSRESSQVNDSSFTSEPTRTPRRRGIPLSNTPSASSSYGGDYVAVESPGHEIPDNDEAFKTESPTVQQAVLYMVGAAAIIPTFLQRVLGY